VLSWALRTMRPGIELELHWIPGHWHHVGPHVLADELARRARILRRSYCSFVGERLAWGAGAVCGTVVKEGLG